MNKTAAIILAVLVVLALGFYLTRSADDADDREPRQGGETVDTSNWETYRNTAYGFELKLPPEWEVAEHPDDPIEPKFNFYPPEVTEVTPFIHHSAVAHVSVFPEGIPTEGVIGEQDESNVSFAESVREARDYVLANGDRWATFAAFENTPESWGQSGFVWASVGTEDFETQCVRDGEEISMEQCDPLASDDTLVRDGEVDEELREVQRAILESFRFVETDTANNGDGTELPAAAIAVRAAVAERAGIAETQVSILEVEEREWPNSCLGLAGEDEVCAQVITPGYRVRAQAGGEVYVYHTNESGSAIRAEEE